MPEGAKHFSLLFSEYQGSILGVKQPGCDFERPPPSSTEAENELTLPRFRLAAFDIMDRETFNFAS